MSPSEASPKKTAAPNHAESARLIHELCRVCVRCGCCAEKRWVAPRGWRQDARPVVPELPRCEGHGLGPAQEFRQGAGVTCRVQVFRRPPVSRNSWSGPKYPPRALYSTTFACVSRPSMGRETQAKVGRCIPRRDIARAHRLVPRYLVGGPWW